MRKDKVKPPQPVGEINGTISWLFKVNQVLIPKAIIGALLFVWWVVDNIKATQWTVKSIEKDVAKLEVTITDAHRDREDIRKTLSGEIAQLKQDVSKLK